MKKITIVMMTAVISFAAASTLKAQDIITTLDGKELKVTIVEEDDDNVKFKNIGSTVVRTMPASNISLIKYEDGSRREFDSKAKPAAPKTAAPVRRAAPAKKAVVEEEDEDEEAVVDEKPVSPVRRSATAGSSAVRRSSATATQRPASRISYDEPIIQPRGRRGYVGLTIGSGMLGLVERNDNGLSAAIVGFNVGYLFAPRVGIQASYTLFTPFESDRISASDIRFGPLFSFGKRNGVFAFDLRPSLIYSLNNIATYDSVAEWGGGLGITARWNLKTVAFTTGMDINVTDFVMLGFTIGVDFRLP